ncbi:Gfo/Idh/MocA family protein [Shewanella sp. YLB-07]|uniref:Gfo/Idh/MocA family protein n=1 Tax=Shewanella sp. YLB-07 TaxID=2601268 RepID=UPI00128E574E|nr:Gfo/Idh/MocA family oxidoreductase [Shewanella sp. YLB-07]MPY22925.1 Gfo/Idh/MocA family oxidoreductase [Shewanella sp. YLB-07]
MAVNIKRIRIGVIGFDTIGKYIVDGALAHNEFEVVAIFDPSLPSVSAEFMSKAEYRHIRLMASANELVSCEQVDLVYIATPPASHIEYCRLALTQGKAIWCEKPLSIDLSAAGILVEEVEASGVMSAVNLSLASSPILDKLVSLTKEVEHGEARQVEMRFHYSEWPRHWQAGAANWLSSREQGGFLREVFSHFVFLQHRLFGEMKLTNCQISFVKGGCETYVMAEYLCGDLPIRVSGGIGGVAPDTNEWTLYTDRRAIRFSDWNKLSMGTLERWSDIDTGQVGSSVLLQLDEVAKMMAGKPNKLASFGEALAVQVVVEQTLNSSC